MHEVLLCVCFHPFNSIFQGEQGPPGPQGPEEVIEFPPDFLPPKGYKVKAKLPFVFIRDCWFSVTCINLYKDKSLLFFFIFFPASQGDRGPPGSCGPKGISVSFILYVFIQVCLRGREFYLHFLPYQGGRGDVFYIDQMKGEQGILGFPGVRVGRLNQSATYL